MDVVGLLRSKSHMYHFSNYGGYPYIRHEFNKLVNNEPIEQTPLIQLLDKYSTINIGDDILYIKGDINELDPYKIGDGSEAIVLNNTPFSVLKIMNASPNQMIMRNNTPAFLPCTIKGILEHQYGISYIYYQPKVSIVPKDKINFYQRKIDVEMLKHGFFQVMKHSNDIIRIYTDGFVVVDDVGIDNIGLCVDGSAYIIDCSVSDIDNWEYMNDTQIENKVACISHNSSRYGLDHGKHHKQIVNNIKRIIRLYENDLDNYLSDNNIEYTYKHIK